jgi:membrane-associated phospholipid phosphatase
MTKTKIARIISDIFNGFLTMILTPSIAIFTSPLPTTQKIMFFILYLLSPILPYLILRKMGKVTDYEFTNRKERPPYFTTISLLFGILFLLITTLNIEALALTRVSLNIFIVSSVITLITFFWKISGHMTYSTILFITLVYLFPSTPALMFLFVLTPIIAWSRIVLNKHTLTQVILGTLIPLSISILIYWPFW